MGGGDCQLTRPFYRSRKRFLNLAATYVVYSRGTEVARFIALFGDSVFI